MMHRHDEDMVFHIDLDEEKPHQGSFLKIERLARFFLNDLYCLLHPLLHRQPAKIDLSPGRRPPRRDDLHRPLSGHRERRPERLMPVDQLIEAGADRPNGGDLLDLRFPAGGGDEFRGRVAAGRGGSPTLMFMLRPKSAARAEVAASTRAAHDAMMTVFFMEISSRG